MRSSTLTALVCFCALVALGQVSLAQAPPSTPAPAQGAPAAGAPQAPPKLQPRPQSKPGMASGSASDSSKQLPGTTPVITLKGLCSAPAAKPKTESAKPAACSTIVTKKQLEEVIEAVRPGLAANQRLPLASQYAQLLVIADAAQKAGVDKDPMVQEELRLRKMEVLAGAYSRKLAAKTSAISDADLQKYYKDNLPQFMNVKLLRIFVPSSLTADGKPADPAAGKSLAEKIQKRAAAGEDFEKLQKDAFVEANNKGTPPSVDMGERRRGSLPPNQESAVFELKPGEVSPIYEEGSGFYVYKMVSREPLPFDKVQDEIKNTISRERFREALEKIKSKVSPDFNEAYFGGVTMGAPGQPPAVVPRAGAVPGAAAGASGPGSATATPQSSTSPAAAPSEQTARPGNQTPAAPPEGTPATK